MKMKRRVVGGFQYWECDAFADYLHRQSLDGWHFKEWRLGMVFEKGEPEDIDYDVEIFVKNREDDQRPSIETEEFADYCEAAGWELLDIRGKFCVFRKIRRDAIPITDPEERYQNIRKGEWNSWWTMNTLPLFWLFWYGWRSWNSQFQEYMFNDLMLVIVCMFMVYGVCAILVGIKTIWELWRAKQILDQGGTPVYGKKHRPRLSRNIGVLTPFVAALLFFGWGSAESGSMWFLLGVISVVVVLNVVKEMWKPSRDTYLAFSLIGPMVFVVILLVGTALIVSRLDEETEPEQTVKPYFTQADYKEVEGEQEVRCESQKGSLGTYEEYRILYEDPEDEDALTDMIWYEVATSEHEWILNRFQKLQMKKMKTFTDCAEVFGAAEAYRGEDAYSHLNYLVRYEDKVLFIGFLSGEQELTGEQMRIISEQMGE